jgi:hypothetical protein
VILRVPPEVNADVGEALEWLVRKGSYTGVAKLWAEWNAGLAAIESAPHLHPPADEAPPGREVRNYLTRRFGYRIVYEVKPAEIRVVAFVRTRRRPSAWLDRLTPDPDQP